MTTALEQAFPLAANWVPATVRAKLAECSVFLSATADLSAEDFTIQPWAAVAVYGPEGDLEFYAYDADDTVTADDGGVSCIVVSGRRYKKRIDVIVRDSVLSATTSAEPGSPALGDAYVLPASPTGTDWAGHGKDVATYTARGWIFREAFIGMVVYVEDAEAFHHFDADGNWTLGFGAGVLADGAVTPKKLFHPFAILKVVDQRNAPPGGTPVDGTMYQVGTSPTGAFAGHANAVARWNGAGAGAWEFFAPAADDVIVRLDLSLLYSFRAGAWVPTVPASGVQQIKTWTSSGTFSNVTGTVQRDAGATLTSTLGKYLKITVLAGGAAGSGGSGASTHSYEIGIYADTGSSPIVVLDTGTASASATGPNLSFAGGPTQVFLYAVPDGSAHNYNFGIRRTSGSDANRDFAYSATVLVEEIVLV